MALHSAHTLTRTLAPALQHHSPLDQALTAYQHRHQPEALAAYHDALTIAHTVAQPPTPQTLLLWSALSLLPDEATHLVTTAPNHLSPHEYDRIVTLAHTAISCSRRS